jgi:hypothetical protein
VSSICARAAASAAGRRVRARCPEGPSDQVAERDAARTAVREAQPMRCRSARDGRAPGRRPPRCGGRRCAARSRSCASAPTRRDAATDALAKLAGELVVTARTAREEVERHAAARVQGGRCPGRARARGRVEAALAAERARRHAEGALRSEPSLAHRARPRRQRRVRGPLARRAELEALTAAATAAPDAAVPDGLILDLGRGRLPAPRRAGRRGPAASALWRPAPRLRGR